MYTWDEDTSSWYGDAKYSYSSRGAEKRKESAKRAEAGGPRTYNQQNEPNEKIIDPQKHISTNSTNPLIIAIDVRVDTPGPARELTEGVLDGDVGATALGVWPVGRLGRPRELASKSRTATRMPLRLRCGTP